MFKGKLKPKLSELELREARTAWHLGESLRSLGRKYNISHSNLKRHLDDNYRLIRTKQIEDWKTKNPAQVKKWKKTWNEKHKNYIKEYMIAYKKEYEQKIKDKYYKLGYQDGLKNRKN